MDRLTHIIVEKRGEKEDDQLELAFRRICDSANALGKHTPFELVMIPKTANSAGLQLADLVARPVGIKVLRPQQPNRAYDIVATKFRRSLTGEIKGWGLKCSHKMRRATGETSSPAPTGNFQSDLTRTLPANLELSTTLALHLFFGTELLLRSKSRVACSPLGVRTAQASHGAAVFSCFHGLKIMSASWRAITIIAYYCNGIRRTTTIPQSWDRAKVLCVSGWFKGAYSVARNSC